MIFEQARRDRSGWKRWQRAAICIGMGIALIAFIGVVYSEKEDGTEKSMFSVYLWHSIVSLILFGSDLSFLDEPT
jgi:hypothetical protein